MFPEDVAAIRRTRKKYNQAMFQSGVAAFRQLEELEAGVLRDGALSQRTKELIALGISVATGCYG